MWAAAEGRSTLGIPQSVGREFVAADGVEAQAAGVLFTDPTGHFLLGRRTSSDHGGEWSVPGGMVELGEDPESAAHREAAEEVGQTPASMRLMDRQASGGLGFTTFAAPVDAQFTPPPHHEHSEWGWFHLGNLPEPLHPGLASTLSKVGGAEDMDPEDWEQLRTNFSKWTREEEAEAEHAQDHAPALALDRGSVRRKDSDGHLHVERTPITKAAINPYYGREIPDYEALGLEPNHKYRLLRHPDELQRAVASFAGKPLLVDHTPLSADDHPHKATVGSVGQDVRWDPPYLTAPIVVWDGNAIDGIEDRSREQLSACYRYRADMTPGSYKGEPYDGVMRDISANHVALVPEGRAGADVLVMDNKPRSLRDRLSMNATVNRFALDAQWAPDTRAVRASAARGNQVGAQDARPTEETTMANTRISRTALMLQGALVTHLTPLLAQDAAIDLPAVTKGVTSANFAERRDSVVSRLKRATKGKLAQDADLGDLTELLDALEEVKPDEAVDEDMETEMNGGEPAKKRDDEEAAEDEDPRLAKVREFCAGKLSEEDLARLDEMLGAEAAMDEDNAEKRDNESEAANLEDRERREHAEDSRVTRKAMDTAITEAVARERKRLNDLQQAHEDVRPYIGKVGIAADSADDVYRSALSAMGVDLKDVHASAFRPLLLRLPRPSAPAAVMAQDAAAAKGFTDRYPGASRIGTA